MSTPAARASPARSTPPAVTITAAPEFSTEDAKAKSQIVSCHLLFGQTLKHLNEGSIARYVILHFSYDDLSLLKPNLFCPPAEPFDGSHKQVPRAQGQRQRGALLRDLPRGRAEVRQQEHHRRAGHAEAGALGARRGDRARVLSGLSGPTTQGRVPRADDGHDDDADRDAGGGAGHSHPRPGEPSCPLHLRHRRAPLRRGREAAATAASGVGRGLRLVVDVGKGW